MQRAKTWKKANKNKGPPRSEDGGGRKAGMLR
jgi:hypothetical protein